MLCQSHPVLPEQEETPQALSLPAPVCHHPRRSWLEGPAGVLWWGQAPLAPRPPGTSAGALARGAGWGMPSRLRRSPYLAQSPLRPLALLP